MPRSVVPPRVAPAPNTIQRVLVKGGKKISQNEINKIRKSSGYAGLSGTKKKIADFWIDDPTYEKKFITQTKLWKDLAAAMKDPPREIIALLSPDEFFSYTASLDADKISKPLQSAITSHTNQLGKQRALDFSSVEIHIPQLPTGAPISISTEVGSRTGRDHGAFFRGANTLPNAMSDTTSLVNVELTQQQISWSNYAPLEKRDVAVCPTCHNVDSIVYFEVDHQDAFSHIRDQLHGLALAMNADQTLCNRVKNQLGGRYSDYFVDHKDEITGQQIFPTKSALQHFSNDVGNLMAICRFCNGAFNKSDQAYQDWFGNNPLYGTPFLQSLHLKAKSLVARTSANEGLGTAALNWFKTYHLPTLQQLLTLEKLADSFRKTINRETQLVVDSTFETDPIKRPELLRAREDLSQRNQASLGMIGQVSRYHEDPWTYSFAPGSPKQMEDEIRDVTERRQKRKRQKTDKYAEGFKDRQQTKPQQTSGFANKEEQLQYEQGFQEGWREMEQQRVRGYADAVYGRFSTHNSPYYQNGLSEGQKRVAELKAQAVKDADRGFKNPLAVSSIEPEALRLQNVYLEAFSDRVLEKQSEMQKRIEAQQREIEELKRQRTSSQPQPQHNIHAPFFYTPPQSNVPSSPYQFQQYPYPQYQAPSFQFQTPSFQYQTPSYPAYTPQSQTGQTRPPVYNPQTSNQQQTRPYQPQYFQQQNPTTNWRPF